MFTIVTSNPRKYSEFQDILTKMNIQVKIIDFDIPELQTDDFLELVHLKSEYVSKKLNTPCFVDDAGLFLWTKQLGS